MNPHFTVAAACLVTLMTAAGCAPSYVSAAPLETLGGETLCFFGGTACAVQGQERSVALTFEDDHTIWLDTTPLTGIYSGDAQRFVAQKRTEDDGIYQREEEGVKDVIDDCCDGDSVAWRAGIADELGYTDSAWQRASLLGAFLRTDGEVTPEQWLSVAPLIGTAGNGPEVILPGTPGLGGDVPNTCLSRIAIGHDADWGIGRHLGRGPLAPYLHAAMFGGDAPDEYTKDMGLAGLGAVTCDPRGLDAPCDWYEFSPTAFGGPYTGLSGHPDWSVAMVPFEGDDPTEREVCRDGDSSPCVCARETGGAWSIVPGGCH